MIVQAEHDDFAYRVTVKVWVPRDARTWYDARMDSNLNIYRAPAAEVPAEDRARLEGALAATDPEAVEGLRADLASIKAELDAEREKKLRESDIWDEGFHGKTIERTQEDGESRLVLHFTDGTAGEVTTCGCCGLWGGVMKCGVCHGKPLPPTDGPDGEQHPTVCGACTPPPGDLADTEAELSGSGPV